MKTTLEQLRQELALAKAQRSAVAEDSEIWDAMDRVVKNIFRKIRLVEEDIEQEPLRRLDAQYRQDFVDG